MKKFSLGYAENSKLMGQWQHKNLRYTNRHARRRFNNRKAQGNLPSQRYAKALAAGTKVSNAKGLAAMKVYVK